MSTTCVTDATMMTSDAIDIHGKYHDRCRSIIAGST